MLGSWLARHQGGTEKSLSLDALAVEDAPIASRSSPERTSASPHDAVLSQLHPTPSATGKPGVSDNQPVSPEPNASHSKVGMSPAPSIYTGITANLRYAGNQSNVVQPQPVDVLLDPYDGSTHGHLLPQATHQDHLESNVPLRLVTDSSGSSGETMWSHLSTVLELQGQIAKMHIEMEGIGSGDGKRGKGMMGRGGTSMDDARTFHGHSRLRARAMSNVSNLGSSDEKGIDEEGVGVDDEETEQNKAREEEFAKLADQFEGKKESIRGIMNKLDELSQALTEFHALQAPNIETSSRRSSVMGASSSTPSPMDGSARPPFPQPTDDKTPQSHASLPPFPTLWSPPKTPFSTTSPQLLPPSFSRLEQRQYKTQKPVLPTVLVNSADVGHHTHVFESPASVENLQLHPE
ncbi:hypothetical protein BKA70DRAFT_1251103 [Coprinopsis sp. MPI-PUGE-AT-0042]|nr:hypothetical protein BKA70DRAFT_1251103 [Coprinopsis sp. MPI-PUGE-AT-0042]